MTEEDPGGTGGPDLVAGAFAALDEARIRWALLREDHAAGDDGDVDLLVHPADADRMEAVLARPGFARVLTWRHGYHRIYVAYDEPGDAWIKLDIVTGFAFRTGGELPQTLVNAVLARVERRGGQNRLAAEDEFWALLLHCLLDRGSLSPGRLEQLQGLIVGGEPGGPLRDALGASRGAAVTAVARTRSGDVQSLSALAVDLDAALARPSFGPHIARRAVKTLSPIIKMVRRPGISVAILGPDGAGKTTLIRTLSSGFYLPARSYYLGLYGDNRRPASRASRIVGVTLVGQVATAWRAYLGGAIHRRRGRLVIFDRHGYDALLSPRSGHDSWKRRIRRSLFGRLSPKPDLVVLLDAPADQLRARKQEHGAEELERQRTGYLELAERLRPIVPVELVDATRDAPSVHRHVTAVLWRLFSQRRMT